MYTGGFDTGNRHLTVSSGRATAEKLRREGCTQPPLHNFPGPSSPGPSPWPLHGLSPSNQVLGRASVPRNAAEHMSPSTASQALPTGPAPARPGGHQQPAVEPGARRFEAGAARRIATSARGWRRRCDPWRRPGKGPGRGPRRRGRRPSADGSGAGEECPISMQGPLFARVPVGEVVIQLTGEFGKTRRGTGRRETPGRRRELPKSRRRPREARPQNKPRRKPARETASRAPAGL